MGSTEERTTGTTTPGGTVPEARQSSARSGGIPSQTKGVQGAPVTTGAAAPARVPEQVYAAATADPLKARHRTMWGLGDYATIAREVVAPLGTALVVTAEVIAGERVLDLAAGTGNVAIPAARVGAEVTATDLVPDLLDEGRRRAEAEGAAISWIPADAEALPFGDGAFDVTLSAIGVMFAPHHEAAAAELVRVTRPGGRIGLAAWTPEGFIGRMFATMKPYLPPPPAGVSPPPLWGDHRYVAGLLGEGVTGIEAERRTLHVDHFPAAEDFLGYFKAHYGPTIAAYNGLAAQEDGVARAAALDAELVDLADQWRGDDGSMEWEYLLLTAIRR